MEPETLEAKLRNHLSPIYGLADMVLLMDKNAEIKKLIIEQAKHVLENKSTIDALLQAIEAKTLHKPDLMHKAFDAARERLHHPDWDYIYDDYDEWVKCGMK